MTRLILAAAAAIAVGTLTPVAAAAPAPSVLAKAAAPSPFVSAFPLAPAAPAAAPAPVKGVFADSAGDSGAAPDIAGVDVSVMPNGKLRFHVRFSNRPSELAGDDYVGLLVDADRSGATGSNGWDYLLVVDAQYMDLLRWNGSDWESLDAPSLGSYDERGSIIEISPADLGRTTAFDFVALSGVGDAEPADRAPNNGWWRFPPLAALGPTTAPQVKAGGTLVATFRVDGASQAGRATCAATIRSTKIPGRGSIAVLGTGERRYLAARCTWRIPAGTKGQSLRATVTATQYGFSVSRSFSRVIR